MWLGAGHGPDSRIEFTGVSTVRDGRLVLGRLFWDHAEALAAAAEAD